MSIQRQLTQLEQDLLLLDSIIDRTLEAVHHYATASTALNEEFWKIPTERLVALLNADVPRSLEILTSNTELNTQINKSLETANDSRYSARAPVVAGRLDITFDGQVFAGPATPAPE